MACMVNSLYRKDNVLDIKLLTVALQLPCCHQCNNTALPREMLGLPCTMENLLELAPFVIDWKVVAPYLGLQDAHEKAIEEEHKGTEGRRVAMLKAWHHNIDKNGHQATYGMLCKALKKIGMLDLVEKLCDIYTASSVEQESSATGT